MEKIKKSRIVEYIIIGIGVLIFILAVLRIGMNVGERRARFAGQYGDNYERNFLGPRDERGMMGRFFDDRTLNSHGAVGEIVSINLPEIIISGSDNLEKAVIVGTSTVIRQFQENIPADELKVGDFIVVIGNPNSNAKVEAKLIRMMLR